MRFMPFEHKMEGKLMNSQTGSLYFFHREREYFGYVKLGKHFPVVEPI
jgi:hypothetical protein